MSTPLSRQYDWLNCPASVRLQTIDTVDHFKTHLYKNIFSIFLHGSLTFGCFNPKISDIDLIVITKGPISLNNKRNIIKYLLKRSQTPCPIEVTFVTQNQIEHWQHPCPFDLQFSEKLRLKFENELENDKWKNWGSEQHFDEFLTSHFTLVMKRGICLWNNGENHALPVVPVSDFKKFVLFHLQWVNTFSDEYPIYAILTYCRAYAFLLFGKFLSKKEAANFVLMNCKDFDTSSVKIALFAYQSDKPICNCSPEETSRFIQQISKLCGITSN